MSEIREPIAPSECIEFWARQRAPSRTYLRVLDSERTLYQIVSLPEHFEFFSYTNRAGHPVQLSVDANAVEFSMFYAYDRSTVVARGVTFWNFESDGVRRFAGAEIRRRMLQDPTRPVLHFSPFRQWMNDPHGLCYVEGTFHLFYQFHPNSTDWGPMHWAHATSRDLHQWIHLPVFLHPEQNLARLGATGGAFSGSAFRDVDGSLAFYFTERLAAYDLFGGYTEVQKLARADAALLKPVAVRTVLEGGPPGASCDIRDPKVWRDAETDACRMVLGSSIDGDPAVLLYGSSDGEAWQFIDVLYRAPPHYREHGARCVECPDFFELDGHWVLVMGLVGYHDPSTGRHNLLYASVGSFRCDRFVPYRTELQELDFGTDYYAMQSFDASGRRLAMAWLFNWEFRKPAGSEFSGELSLPRVLSLSRDRSLAMLPERGLGTSCKRVPLVPDQRRTVRPNADPFEIVLSGRLAGLRVEGRDAAGGWFVVQESAGALWISIAEDTGAIAYRSRPLELANLRLYFDRGIIEVFANDGAICGTRRSYRILAPLEVATSAPASASVEGFEAYSLVPQGSLQNDGAGG